MSTTLPAPRMRSDRSEAQPQPASIVPGNVNLIVFFYTEDPFTGQVRISEDYTTPKTYSAAANTEEQAKEKCKEWAERKMAAKSHFIKGYRIEQLSFTPLCDYPPVGTTFADATARQITAAPRRPAARTVWNEHNC